MGVREQEDGRSEGRPVTGRIGIEAQADIIPRESGADVHRVYLYERTWRTFKRRESK